MARRSLWSSAHRSRCHKVFACWPIAFNLSDFCNATTAHFIFWRRRYSSLLLVAVTKHRVINEMINNHVTKLGFRNLLNYVIQLLDLTNFDGCVARRSPRAAGQIDSAFVDRHRLEYAVLLDRLFEITLGRTCPGAEIPPFTSDLHGGFVHPPALANFSLAAADRLLQHGQKLDGPAVHCGTFDRNSHARPSFPRDDASEADRRRTNARRSGSLRGDSAADSAAA
jgi:hypothetical protein